MNNVLIIAADFYPNSTGFANATINLIKSVHEYLPNSMKCFVYTAVPLGNNSEFLEAIVIRSKWSKISKSYCRYREVCKVIENNDIDFILFETNTFPIFENLLVRKYPNKVAVRIHSTADTEVMLYKKAYGSIKERIVASMVKSFMKKCSIIISTNSYHQDFVYKQYYDGNVFTMWNKKQYLLPNTVQSIDSVPIQGNYFLTLGKMSAEGFVQKGISDVLVALSILKRRGLVVPMKIIGDGPYLNRAVEIAKSLGLDKVEFIPTLPHNEVLDCIKESKAVCLASRFEGQSMFATEALSVGKPLILTTDNGMNDLLIENVNGLSIRTGDSNDIAEKIFMMIKMSPEELKRMGDESKKIFDSKFSMRTIAGLFDTIVNINTIDSQE